MDASELSSGRRIGPFLLGRCLGSGGMGSVWEASTSDNTAPVALKVLHPMLSQQHEPRERLRREAEAANRIDHPAVVPVRSVLEIDDQVLLLMDLLEGETLRSRLSREQALSQGSALPIFVELASVLAAAHRVGVVHRDLKPENIFLERGDPGVERVQVLDFGLAKVLEDPNQPPGLTALGTVLGTAAYMAPEQAQGRSVDEGADIWALGVVIYEAFAGCRPFVGNTRAELVQRLLHGAITPLEIVAPQLPRPLCDLASNMLSRKTEARPRATEVERALRKMVRTS